MEKASISTLAVLFYLALTQILVPPPILIWAPLVVLCGWTLIDIHKLPLKNFWIRICQCLNVVVGGFSAVTTTILFIGFIIHNV